MINFEFNTSMSIRTLVSLVLLFFASISFLNAQTDWQKYNHIKGVKYSSVPQLANAITKGLETDREKVEAIYFWVTNNIRYDYKMFLRNKEKEKKNKTRYSGAALAIYEEEIALSGLRSGKGICQHYALIFRDLCKKVGIRAELVGGYGKNDPLKTRSTGEKHAWNAVRLENKWHLFDPTWGSGFVGESEKFVPLFNEDYAFVDPDVFAMNHFPKEAQWQLSKKRFDRTSFRSIPVIGSGYLKFNLSDLEPMENVVEVVQGDTIAIQFNSTEEIEEIICQNLKSEEKIATTLEKDKDQYKLIMTTELLKSGTYAFYIKRQLVFAYRITVGRSASSRSVKK